MNMNRAYARETLIDALVDDAVNAIKEDSDYGANIVRFGHPGFTTYEDSELVQAAIEADLQEDSDEINEACAVLDLNRLRG